MKYIMLMMYQNSAMTIEFNTKEAANYAIATLDEHLQIGAYPQLFLFPKGDD